MSFVAACGLKPAYCGQTCFCASATVEKTPAARKRKDGRPDSGYLAVRNQHRLPEYVRINLIEYAIVLRNAAAVNDAIDRDTIAVQCVRKSHECESQFLRSRQTVHPAQCEQFQPRVMPPRFGFTSTVRSPLSQVSRSKPGLACAISLQSCENPLPVVLRAAIASNK